jgi:hypothetical protein
MNGECSDCGKRGVNLIYGRCTPCAKRTGKVPDSWKTQRSIAATAPFFIEIIRAERNHAIKVLEEMLDSMNLSYMEIDYGGGYIFDREAFMRDFSARIGKIGIKKRSKP